MREISLLGTVQVKSVEEELPRFRSQRAMALLGYLAVERRPLTRAHLAALFWPDDRPESGKTKLRRELYNLAQILPDCWEADRVKVHFMPTAETAIDLDAIRQFEEDEAWQAAAELLRGDFLEGITLEDSFEFETWLLGERERWRQRAGHILTNAIDELETQGAYRRALRHAQRLLQLMPWREETQRQVMRLLALSEQRSAALKQFETCKQVLWDELGVEPAAETLALYERIKRTSHFSRDNIPAVATPLIGREHELEAIAELLVDPDVRLVTITGLGGIGKTRLALNVAWRHTAGQFRDGVAFVQLAALESADLLVPAIAQALHLPLAVADKAPRQQLLDFLKSKQTLLVLDNCEHLLEGMEIVVDILQNAPRINILATSRERLHLRDEHVLPLRGLVYGDDETDHPAAQLFTAAAQRVVPDFEISEANAGYVIRLCRMVDGMPLAIELAAAWLDTMPVEALAAEIEGSLDFLTTDLRDMAPRHRSLRAVLDTTWERLGPQARQVFAALSVFRGSFSRDAAVETADASPHLLTRLVAHSLLEYDHEIDRYQLHDMLRQFAAEQLAGLPEIEQSASQQHYAYYHDLARQGGAAMHGGDQLGWLARLQQEEGNIRQAIDWAVENDVESAARLTTALHTFWHSTGRFAEGLRQCERILPYQDRLSPGLRPWLLAVYADMIWPLGRTQESVALRSQVMQLFKEQGDEAGIAYSCLQHITIASYLQGDIDRSMQLAREGLQHALRPGMDTFYASLLLHALGVDLMDTGRFEEAGARFKQGYQLCIERDDKITANYFLAAMAGLALRRGQYGEVSQLAEQLLSISRQTGMPATELMALNDLGLAAFAEDNLDLAEQHFADGLTLAREASYQSHLATLCISMGDVLMVKGSHLEALTYLREATFIYQKMGEQVGTAECIERLAHWLWQTNKRSRKPVGWLACAHTWLEQTGLHLLPVDKARFDGVRATMEANLGKEQFAQAWSEGLALSLDEALEEVLRQLPQESNWQVDEKGGMNGRLL